MTPLPLPTCRISRTACARARLAALLLAFAAVGASAAAVPPPLLNQYNLAGVATPEATLSSYVECGSIRCDIGYTIATQSVDRFVQVSWKDTSGSVLVSATNAYPSNFYSPAFFGGYINATEWRYGVNGSAPLGIAPLQAVGTADFTGTGSGPDPCGIGYVCNDADYYHWPPSIFSVPTGGAAGRLAATSFTSTITGTLANVGVSPADPTDIGDRRFDFLDFSSTVAYDGTQYVYRYTVTNYTDLEIPFDWAEAGMNGELGPMAAAERSFASAGAPGVLASVASWTLRTTPPFFVQDYANSLPIYAPVPEPARWAQIAAGLICLLIALGRSRHGDRDARRYRPVKPGGARCSVQASAPWQSPATASPA